MVIRNVGVRCWPSSSSRPGQPDRGRRDPRHQPAPCAQADRIRPALCFFPPSFRFRPNDERDPSLISVSDKRGVLDFARKLSALGIQAAVDRRHRQPAARAGLPVTDVSEHYRLSGDARRPGQDPASRRCMAASSPAATSPNTWTRCRRPRHRRIDLVVVNLYPSSRPWPSPTARWKTRSRTSTSAAPPWCAAAKNHGNASRAASASSPTPGTTAASSELEANAGKLSLQDPRFAVKAFTHTARYDSAISNYLTALVTNGPATCRCRPSPSACSSPSTRCRTCATARTRTRPGLLPPARRGRGGVASYTQLQGRSCPQQHRRRRRGVGMREGLRRLGGGLRHRQARQPLWRGRRRQPARGLQEAFSTDPDLGLRRHHRVQRRGRPCRGRGRSAQFLEVLIAPSHTADALSVRSRARRTCACSPARSASLPVPSTTSASVAACWCRAPTRPASRSPTSRWSRSGRRRKPRCATCSRLARGQVRQVQRHRVPTARTA